MTARKAAAKAPAKKAAPRKPRENGLVKPDPKAKLAVRRPPQKPEQAPVIVSIRNVRMGTRTYPLATDPNCAVCVHPARAEIEERILINEGYTKISRWVSGREHEEVDGSVRVWPAVAPEQISKHFNEDHSPLDARFVRDLMEQQVGIQDYEQLGTRLVNGLSFANRIIARAEERMVTGQIEPTVKEALAAARITTAAKMASQEAESVDQSWYYEGSIDRFFTHVKRIMSADQHAEFISALRSDSILRTLYERRENPGGVQETQTTEAQTA